MRLFVDFLRTALTWVVGIVVTVVSVIGVLIVVIFNRDSPMLERIIHAWSRTWMLTTGTSLEVEGSQHVDPDRSYVVVANHQSTLDIMTCFLAVPIPIRFLAKKELFRIPVLAQGMRAVGIVEVDRQARSSVHAEVNRQAKTLIEHKRSLIIYPEGTRPRNGKMARFKKGAFTMAIAGQLPVLPLSIHGTYEAWPPGGGLAHGGDVRAVIDAPIETAGMTHSDTGDLRDRVYKLISERVLEMGGEIAD